jgi:hypothetical protein
MHPIDGGFKQTVDCFNPSISSVILSSQIWSRLSSLFVLCFFLNDAGPAIIVGRNYDGIRAAVSRVCFVVPRLQAIEGISLIGNQCIAREF